MLKIYNNLTRKKELFTPINPENVRMYVCGMTVYDLCHLGHARVLVAFDVVYRYLQHIYGAEHVNYVRNITDIDDKIINRANENGEVFSDLTERFIKYMHQDAEALNILPPNQEPRATTHMAGIISMINTLVEKGFAYAANNGDVYYDVSQFEPYGQLSGKNIGDLQAGARVEVDEGKDDPLDFVLWKAAKPDEPHWDSPWGKGRPGWHIECSAMSTHCLGNHFDIHGGGMDLQFPHHENEIAQSEGVSGEKFVNVWMHNGFVRIDNEKMSKSLGNFFTVREILERYRPEVIRYFILNSHYRSPLNYSDKQLDSAQAALEGYYTALRGLKVSQIEELGRYGERFYAAMDDDFNTAEAIAVLAELRRDINQARNDDRNRASHLASVLVKLAGLLGILQDDAELFLQQGGRPGVSGDLGDAEIENLIRQRNVARQEKNWTESDRIRDLFVKEGIVLEDSAKGTCWRRE
ncbi:MAG TPA: cysteine--tRNA ligase [Gammaproteobacteria bacterium]|nr:cysteine--tRNA ligase [Gammaproteobacteria bacterium]